MLRIEAHLDRVGNLERADDMFVSAHVRAAGSGAGRVGAIAGSMNCPLDYVLLNVIVSLAARIRCIFIKAQAERTSSSNCFPFIK